MSSITKIRRNARRVTRRFLQPARPSWISGAARLVDLGGVFDRYALREEHYQSEAEALASDWSMVGADITTALRVYPLSGEKNKVPRK